MGNFKPPSILMDAPPLPLFLFAGAYYGFSIWNTWSSPVMLYLDTGDVVFILRYGQWLFCTPVSVCVLYTQLLQPPSTPIHSPINLSFLDYVTKVC